MADIASAGTLAAAALQTAGLVTQEKILVEFAEFFRSAGALIYVFAGIGGVVSVVLFGSYRMARYLLLGPAIFWFLVGTYTESAGVVWQVGGGAPQVIKGVGSQSDSTKELSEVVKKTGMSVATGQTYKVAFAFDWYTRLIDEFIRKLIDKILAYENDEDLLFIARTQAFDSILHSEITNSETMSIIRADLMGPECIKMVNTSVALASPQLDAQALQVFGVEAAGGNPTVSVHSLTMYDLLKKERDRYQKIYEAAAKENVSPHAASRDFINRVKDQNGASKKVLDSHGVSDANQLSYLTCGEMWSVAEEAILHEAEKEYARLLKNYVPVAKDASNRRDVEQKLCQFLSNKFRASQSLSSITASEGECNLVPLHAIFMLRNAVSSPDAENSFIQRHKNNLQVLNSDRPEDRFVAITQEPSRWKKVGQFNGRRTNYNESKEQTEALFYDQTVAGCKDKRNYDVNCHAWHPVAKLGAVRGAFATALSDHQSYQAQGLRARIFAWALQVPYWQGVIIYLLSISYPFVALIVIVPGHANAFLSLPLAWLWVKSWDIGFALVRVLDKVLWNVLPQSDIAAGAIPGLGGDTPPLPDIIREAFKVDPTYHVHAYYFLISTALLSIPEITAYATLKGRRAILASFSNGPRQIADVVRSRSEHAAGMEIIAARQRSLDARRGIAAMAHSPTTTGVLDAGGSGVRALQTTGQAQAVKMGADFSRNLLTGGAKAQSLMRTVMNGGRGAVGDFGKMWGAEVGYAREYDGFVGPLTGALSQESLMSRAAISALEAETFGFEGGDAGSAGDALGGVMNREKTRYGVLSDAAVTGIQRLGAGVTGSANKLSKKKKGDNAQSSFVRKIFEAVALGNLYDSLKKGESSNAQDKLDVEIEKQIVDYFSDQITERNRERFGPVE